MRQPFEENDGSDERSRLRAEMEKALRGGAGPKAPRFALACLSGVIPLAGGAVGGVASACSEGEQAELNKLFAAWMRLQEQELQEIGITLMEVNPSAGNHFATRFLRYGIPLRKPAWKESSSRSARSSSHVVGNQHIIPSWI